MITPTNNDPGNAWTGTYIRDINEADIEHAVATAYDGRTTDGLAWLDDGALSGAPTGKEVALSIAHENALTGLPPVGAQGASGKTGRRCNSSASGGEPPNSVPAEQALLGVLLRGEATWADVAAALNPSDFCEPANAAIATAMATLADMGRGCDRPMVESALEAAGRLADIGGSAHLDQLTAAPGIAANIDAYAAIFHRTAAQRKAAAASQMDPGSVLDRLSGTGGTGTARPPMPADLIATEAELAAAHLTPRCIVRDHTYADVAQVVAPGSTGKTTVLIYESVCIAIGRPVWSLAVESPGWTFYVSAEDQRPRLLARLREILRAMDLTADERAAAVSGFRVWDVAGEQVKLIRAEGNNIVLTDLADAIVTAYRDDPPAVVVFDPLVSFGASEQAINDNEQGIITAARRIVKGLDCCVRVVHHTGKANAREGTLDQYSGRGGSALADGSRMTTVLQAWGPDSGTKGLVPPPGCTQDPGTSITILARAKLSYAPPQPIIWIRRRGFAFEHFAEAPKLAPAALRSAQADQVERYLASEIAAGRYHTKTSLGIRTEDLGMPREGIRRAVVELEVSGRIAEANIPEGRRQGGRKTYLCPINPAGHDGGVGAPVAIFDGQPRRASTPPPPLGYGVAAGLPPPATTPPLPNPAGIERRGTAGLAGLTNDAPPAGVLATVEDDEEDLV